MKLIPAHTDLQQHIDHYWIVRDVEDWFYAQKQLYAFPGITPEMFIVLEGHLTYRYQGQRVSTQESTLFGFIHGDIHLDLSALRSFAIVVFQARALSSVMPFLRVPASTFIQRPIQPLEEIFADFNHTLLCRLRNCSATELAAELDGWLLGHYRPGRSGLLTHLAQELPRNFDLKDLRKQTNCSVSTLERHFKQDTGLRPKQYQRIHRFRGVIEHLYATRSADWSEYVDQFGFFDQSHFIREVRAFTGFTPTQLLTTPGLLPYRPA